MLKRFADLIDGQEFFDFDYGCHWRKTGSSHAVCIDFQAGNHNFGDSVGINGEDICSIEPGCCHDFDFKRSANFHSPDAEDSLTHVGMRRARAEGRLFALSFLGESVDGFDYVVVDPRAMTQDFALVSKIDGWKVDITGRKALTLTPGPISISKTEISDLYFVQAANTLFNAFYGDVSPSPLAESKLGLVHISNGTVSPVIVETLAETLQRFNKELFDSFESIEELANQYSVSALSDLIYLQAAILNGRSIDVTQGEVGVADVIRQLPSADEWLLNYVSEYDSDGHTLRAARALKPPTSTSQASDAVSPTP